MIYNAHYTGPTGWRSTRF